MRCKTAPRFDVQFNIVCPKALVEAVQQMAAQNWISANAYARGALLEALKRDGVKVKLEMKQSEAA
jgi:hypothetical protein